MWRSRYRYKRWWRCIRNTSWTWRLEADAEIIGINHRDLKTFQTDVTLSQRLRPLIPQDKVVIAESGISSREDVIRLKESHIDAVLVGEALVTASDVAAKVRELARS